MSFADSVSRVQYNTPRWLIEGLVEYASHTRPDFLNKTEGVKFQRCVSESDDRPVVTELLFVNSVGKSCFRPSHVVDQYLIPVRLFFLLLYNSEFSKQLRLKNLHLLNHCSSSAKDHIFNLKHVFQVLQQCKKPANQLKFKLELIYPIVDDPEARLPKLKNQMREVQGKFGNKFDQDTIKTCVRKHQDAQRYARQSARATTFFKYMNGKCDLNILEKRIEGFFQRQKWTTPEDVKQDIRKVFYLCYKIQIRGGWTVMVLPK